MSTRSMCSRSIAPFTNGMLYPPKNKVAVTDDATTMFAYSAMKNSAKRRELYSVWYPATSSASPSGRSKGLRLHSAKAETQNKMKATRPTGGLKSTPQLRIDSD